MELRVLDDRDWQKIFLWKLTIANLKMDKANKRRQINRMQKIWK
jgi:hypothetical protein